MDLFEYQARDMFEKHGVPVLRGIVATTPDEAQKAAEDLGGGVCVVKAQVKTGGRGKAGGVKLAKSPAEAREHAEAILGMDIKGHTVHRVMIAEGAKIAEEYYFSVLLDRSERRYLAMCSVEGGVEIEQLAVERPEALARVDCPTLLLVGSRDEEVLEQLQDEMYDFFILSRQNEEVRRRLLDEVPMEDWAVALKGTEALLRRSIYAVMPKRQAQQLEAITARLGPVPVSRIEQIRREIMGIARELEEAGEIQLQLFAEQTAE